MIADVTISVKDAKAAAKGWQEKAGFEVYTVGPPGGHAVMVAPPGERFLLHLCEGIEEVAPGNTGIAFVTDDLEGEARRLLSGGVQFTEPLKVEPWGGMAKFADPDGNVFWLLGARSAFIREQIRRRARDTLSKARRAASRARRRSGRGRK